MRQGAESPGRLRTPILLVYKAATLTIQPKGPLLGQVDRLGYSDRTHAIQFGMDPREYCRGVFLAS